MSDELKPCPFCGFDAGGAVKLDNAFYVLCSEPRCGIEGPFRRTKRGAITAWNRRADVSERKEQS